MHLLYSCTRSQQHFPVQSIKRREVVEDDKQGFQRVHVESLAEWRFLRFFHGTFTTALEVVQNEKAGTVRPC